MVAKRGALVFLAVALAGQAMVFGSPAMASGSSVKMHTVAPTKAERTAILKAFGEPKEAWHCQIVRLAASNHNYGTVRIRTKTSCQQWAWDGRNIFKRGKKNHWKAVFEGSDYSCPLPRIPRQVQRDLGVCA